MSFARIDVKIIFQANYDEALHYFAKSAGHTTMPRALVLVEIERAAQKAAEAQTRKDRRVTADDWRVYCGTITARSGVAARPEHKQPVDGGKTPLRMRREAHRESVRAALSVSPEDRWAAWLAGPRAA